MRFFKGKMDKYKTQAIVKCKDCGKLITWDATYCSSCAKKGTRSNRYNDGKSLKKYYCIICGKEISYNSKSGKCRSCGRKGFKFSKKAREKMSKTHTGTGLKALLIFKCISCGKKISENCVRYGGSMCKVCTGKRLVNEGIIKGFGKGKDHYNWQNGLTSFTRTIRRCFQYRQWRSDIFTRDDFTCQECGKRGGNLEAHHTPKSFAEIIKEYYIKTLQDALMCAELWNINGGKTLCEKCHNKTKRK